MDGLPNIQRPVVSLPVGQNAAQPLSQPKLLPLVAALMAVPNKIEPNPRTPFAPVVSEDERMIAFLQSKLSGKVNQFEINRINGLFQPLLAKASAPTSPETTERQRR